MGASRIEQLIEDIYEFVESCRMQPLSTTKVIVPKDELYDLLDELRLRTPDEIKRYQKIISNRDAIIADAEEKAAAIMAEAGEKAHSLINDHEIMQQAYYQANEMVSKAAAEADKIIADANNDANQIRAGALSYTEEMLSDVENILTNAYESSRTKYENLLNALKGNLDIVINNKNELKNSGQEYTNEESATEQTGEEYSDDDFNFDENTFLEDIE
ncbi:ATPase [Anaerocolumna sedimenticola]|uniref:ATPase n=1 Tax=Anaerocolumna sedimenticola TaxID=2696063 RepID=A0A6P1TQL9_9FIRM|nr:ATPase [Anaerocolumna sedimenticola]QHQ62502.1 ATPase [Anaerocolumna sedimenticola]